MIDIHTEHLVPIRDVPRLLPTRRTGRRAHVSTIWRWTLRGVRGVRLEAVRVGGTSYTSVEALQRFSERLAAKSAEDPANDERDGSGKQQARVAERVEKLLGAERKKEGAR